MFRHLQTVGEPHTVDTWKPSPILVHSHGTASDHSLGVDCLPEAPVRHQILDSVVNALRIARLYDNAITDSSRIVSAGLRADSVPPTVASSLSPEEDRIDVAHVHELQLNLLTSTDTRDKSARPPQPPPRPRSWAISPNIFTQPLGHGNRLCDACATVHGIALAICALQPPRAADLSHRLRNSNTE